MGKNLPSLNGLRAFDAAARSQSVAKAADRLGITPSAVSHRIRSLEEALGLTLFDRSGRALRLSEAGEALLPGLTEGFDRIAAAVATAEATQKTGVLTVSMLSTFAQGWFIPRLVRFQRRHPEIEVHIATSLQVVDLERDAFDCAIRFGAGAWPDLRADRLVAESIVPMAAPGLLAADPPVRKPEDLLRHTILLAETRLDQWALWLASAGLPAVEPARKIVFETSNFALQAALEGAGIAIAPREFAAEQIGLGRLAVPFDRPLRRPEAYYLVSLARRAAEPKLAAFREWLLEEAEEPTPPAVAGGRSA